MFRRLNSAWFVVPIWLHVPLRDLGALGFVILLPIALVLGAGWTLYAVGIAYLVVWAAWTRRNLRFFIDERTEDRVVTRVERVRRRAKPE